MEEDNVSSEVSSETSIDLSLSCSFSSFDDSTVPELEDHVGEHEVVELYGFEPLASASDTSDEGSAAEDADENSQDEERLHNRDWLAP